MGLISSLLNIASSLDVHHRQPHYYNTGPLTHLCSPLFPNSNTRCRFANSTMWLITGFVALFFWSDLNSLPRSFSHCYSSVMHNLRLDSSLLDIASSWDVPCHQPQYTYINSPLSSFVFQFFLLTTQGVDLLAQCGFPLVLWPFFWSDLKFLTLLFLSNAT